MNLDLGDTRLIIDECKRYGCLRNQAASILGNVHRETGGAMIPIKETVMPWHKDKNPSDSTVKARLENAWKSGKLKWVKTPYWREGWFGRGLIQPTHRENYLRAEKELGVPFTRDPSLILEVDNSVKVAVRGCMEGWFTGKKTSDYCTLKKSNFYQARRVVNGLEAASEVAKFSLAYDKALEAEGYGVTDAKPIPIPKAKPSIHKSLVESKEMIGGATGLIAALSAFFDKLDGNTVAIILAALAAGFIANRLYARWKGER